VSRRRSAFKQLPVLRCGHLHVVLGHLEQRCDGRREVSPEEEIEEAALPRVSEQLPAQGGRIQLLPVPRPPLVDAPLASIAPQTMVRQ